MFAKLLEFIREQHIPAKRQAKKKYEQECREDSFDASSIKFSVANSVALKIAENYGGNKEP